MKHALRLADRVLGRAWPNPAVGCVIVKDGQIIGTGFTQPGGRPHAETIALKQAGPHAKGATLYTTLEPCAHHGRTPPCAEALIQAGIAHVVSATRDPDARVNGQGIAMLKDAHIHVTEGAEEKAAKAQNQGFFLRTTQQRPLIALKIASSIDGSIATRDGESQWITGEASRRHAHGLRTRYDAILTGIGTVLADDPLLTCRLPGLEHHSPVRILLDRKLRLTPEHKLVQSLQKAPLWLVTTSAQASSPAAQGFAKAGVTVIDGGDMKEIEPVLKLLGERGLTRILVEAGMQLSTSLIRDNLVEEAWWYQAATLMGHDAMPAVGELNLQNLSKALRLQVTATQQLGTDLLVHLAKGN
ncbi:bifunctional diaminohydroxyphosphoribosylaminopyrimidine deaminase/5-amino-6-(5-phosphoribosylamino)uracil reductase RibD [bacterium]|nr:bifunctional diaminohydroxyphosphoribosylaminopyrimidine deaminase/5-amino-6-(5-phosphoribosylamino)uracil reductase RibD [bacterium]